MSADGFSYDLDETALQELYTWIDEIPLSRPKKNISRDFSDGGKCTSLICVGILEMLKPCLIQLISRAQDYLENNTIKWKCMVVES